MNTEAFDRAWRLDGRVAVITGGARNLGFDIADALAGAGCRIVLSARTVNGAERAAEVLRQRHQVEVLGLPLELADPQSIARFSDEACGWHGRADVLVNNAGGGTGEGTTNLFERDPAEIAATITTNLVATILCCREVGRHMVAQRSGKIINVASIAGLVGRDRQIYRQHGVREPPVDYAAAKAGVLGFTRDLAAVLSPEGVQVNSLSPGGFDKGTLPPGFVADYARLTPLGRMGQIGTDIQGAALFLASAASDYVTGQNLVVDGGFSAIR